MINCDESMRTFNFTAHHIDWFANKRNDQLTDTLDCAYGLRSLSKYNQPAKFTVWSCGIVVLYSHLGHMPLANDLIWKEFGTTRERENWRNIVSSCTAWRWYEQSRAELTWTSAWQLFRRPLLLLLPAAVNYVRQTLPTKTTMDWNKRNQNLSFYNFYRRYLSNASSRFDQVWQLDQPLAFSAYERMAIACVLKETLLKLGIVSKGVKLAGKSIASPSVALASIDERKIPMNIRFKNHILDKLYDERTLQPMRECFKAMSNAKLSTDIEVICSAVQICFSEFQTLNQFDRFATFILAENREACDEFILLRNFSVNADQLASLNEQLNAFRQKGQQTIDALNEEIFHLTTECEDSRTKHIMENRMVAKWEETRQEQCDAIFEHEIRRLENRRTKIVEKSDTEMVAINGLRTFYRLNCEKLENSISNWRRRYETERKFLDDEIRVAVENIEDVQSKYALISNWHRERDAFIENYRTEQKELETRRKHEARQCQAAIQIQAWWRGTMVRKQLGPYRPKKKSKKNKNEKRK